MSTIELTEHETDAGADVGPDFATVYSENLNKVWRYVRARVPDHAEAHDITSDVFVRAWRAWDRFDPGRGPVEPWLFTIASRAVVDWHRRRRPEPVDASTVVDLAGAGLGEDGPEAAILKDELLVQLAAALEQLSDREREGLALRFAARLSSGDVARVLGTSPDAAKQMLHRAIGKLRGLGVEEQGARAGAVADLESVIDDVLARGHVSMSDSELHGMLVHLAAVHDAPVPKDLGQHVADCVACEVKEDVAADIDEAGTPARGGKKRLAAGSLAWVLAYANVCLACGMPTLAWGLSMLGLGALSMRIHELSLVTAPLIAYLTWRGIRRHGNALGFKLALAGSAVLMVHTTAHYVSMGLRGAGPLNAVQRFFRPMYDSDLLFTASDMIGGLLVVAGALVHLTHTQRWRDVQMREFQRATVIDRV